MNLPEANDLEGWYAVQDAGQLNTPCLLVYRERVKANISQAIRMAGADKLRPHVKTVKAIEPVLMMLEQGITKFKCATFAEAEMLALANAGDVLLAYPVVGPAVDRFAALVERYPQTAFSCLCDQVECAEVLSKCASKAGTSFRVFIDLNVGMNRTGISPEGPAEALFKRCLELEGLLPRGFHAYDGHITSSDDELRNKEVETAFVWVTRLRSRIETENGVDIELVAGGTPTFEYHAGFADRDCSPGTFVYWDRGYQLAYPWQNFQPAALVLTRVVSLPAEGLVCLDLGYKAIASEKSIEKRVYFLNAPELEVISHSEEHLVVWAGLDHHFQIGELLYGLPWHICPTVALYSEAVCIQDQHVSGSWKTVARDRKIYS